jgi:lysyl-tRNA synthetase class 1
VPVLFETGYGPSGFHIGTFQEVLRTTLVRAYEVLTEATPPACRLFRRHGRLRKVPDNVPARMLTAHLQEPLSRIPDPFGTHESFAHHNNAMLRIPRPVGFDYEFVSGAERYNGAISTRRSGVLRNFDAIMASCCPRCARNAARPIRRSWPISPSNVRASGADRGGRCRGHGLRLST